MYTESFGQWLKQRRKHFDFTQEDLAERIGCAFETIRKIEAGRRKPSRQMAELLATTLGVPLEEVHAFIEFARLAPGSEETEAVPGEGAPSALPFAQPRPRQRPPRLSNLPSSPTTFVGRERELERVSNLLSQEDVRLVTLTGPPGIGKTRLSLQTARRMEAGLQDGALFVDLSSVFDPDLVAQAIARGLGLKKAPDQSLTATLTGYLGHKELLLVLDNFEQVTQAAPLVGEIVAACPRLKVLVTSRTPLRVYGEHQVGVPPLSLPEPEAQAAHDPQSLGRYEALDLFVQRSRAIVPQFNLTADNAPVITEICRQLDGLPLAIELAAARTKLLPPRAILERLTNKLKLLTQGAFDLPPRQRTIRAAIDWSYDLLDNNDKALFRRMAVFADGTRLDALEAVCRLPHVPGEVEPDILDGVNSLLDKSLLRREDDPNGQPRYWMLLTIREYALDRLAENKEENEAVHRQHAQYFLALAEEAEPALTGPMREPWLHKLDAELGNLRAALSWSILDFGFWILEPRITQKQSKVQSPKSKAQNPKSKIGAPSGPPKSAIALRLAGALHWFWYFRGFLTEGRSWLERALQLTGSHERTAARAKALDAAGRLALLQDDYAAMRPPLEEAVSIWREVGEARGLAYSLTNLGIATVYHNRAAGSAGRSMIQEAVALFREINDKWGLAFALDLLGDATILLGDAEQREGGYKEESLQLYRELGDQWGVASQLNDLGYLAIVQGDYETARLRLEESLAIACVVGDRWYAAHSARSLGDALWHQGDAAGAAALYQESLYRFRELSDRRGESNVLRNLGHLAMEAGDYREAHALYKQSLALVRDLGNTQAVVLCIAALAGVMPAYGDVASATKLLSGSHALRESLHGIMPPSDLLQYRRNLKTLQASLTEEAFTQAWEEGRGMSVEQALAIVNEVRPG